MRFFWLCTAVLALITGGGSLFAAEEKPAEKNEAKPDAERIIGTCILEASDRNPDFLQGDGQTVEVTFGETSFQFVVLKDGGKVLEISGTYVIDDKQTPKIFDVTLTGDGGTNLIYAIYEFQGDKFRTRFRDNNGTRPADFDSQASDCGSVTSRSERYPSPCGRPDCR